MQVQLTSTHMKRTHPTMDDPAPPTSPHKKLKLQEPSLGTEMVDYKPEVMAGILHHDLNTASKHPSKQSTLDSADLFTSPQWPSTIETLQAPRASAPSIAMPKSKVDDSHDFPHEYPHDYPKAPGDLLSKQVPSVSKAQSTKTYAENSAEDSYSKEATCGITEFVSPDLLGFSGILKKRYAF